MIIYTQDYFNKSFSKTGELELSTVLKGDIERTDKVSIESLAI